MTTLAPKTDLEKGEQKGSDISTSDVVISESQSYNDSKVSLWRWLAKWGVEVRGIEPVPVEERVKTDYYNIFFMWISIMCNLLP
jgi:hypothetical protein